MEGLNVLRNIIAPVMYLYYATGDTANHNTGNPLYTPNMPSLKARVYAEKITCD